MAKQQRYFAKIAEFKDRFRLLPTEAIRKRLSDGALQKEAAVALRELLVEREALSDDDHVAAV